MENTGRRNERNVTAGQRQLWIVTFGDLLTLLLCFFLSIVSFGPLNQSEHRLKPPPSSENHGVTAGSRPDQNLKQASGTEFALQTSETSELLVEFQESDFELEGGRLLPPAQQRLKSELNSIGCTEGRVMIETCSKFTEQGMEQSWFTALNRALTLQSQIIDAGIKAELKVRSVGPHCDVLGGGLAGRLKLSAGEQQRG